MFMLVKSLGILFFQEIAMDQLLKEPIASVGCLQGPDWLSTITKNKLKPVSTWRGPETSYPGTAGTSMNAYGWQLPR